MNGSKPTKPKKKKVNPYNKPKKEKATSKYNRPKPDPGVGIGKKEINKPKRELVNPYDSPKGSRKPKMMKGGKIAMSYNKGGLIQQD